MTIAVSIAAQLMTIAVPLPRPPADLFPSIHGQFPKIHVLPHRPPADLRVIRIFRVNKINNQSSIISNQ